MLVCPPRQPICSITYFFKHRGSYRQTSRLSPWNRPSIIIHYPIHLIANNYGASRNNNSKAGVSRVSYISRGCVISDSTTDIVITCPTNYSGLLYNFYRAKIHTAIFLTHFHAKRILSFITSAFDSFPYISITSYTMYIL